MKKNLPTFVGIGAQRAGTTWLYKQFVQHPEIWIPPIKELHVFDKKILETPSPIERLFSSKKPERKTMIKGSQKIVKYLSELKLFTAQWWIKWVFGYYDNNWYRSLFSQGLSYPASGEITPKYAILAEKDVARLKDINPDLKIILMIRHPIERAWSAVRFFTSRGTFKIKINADDDIVKLLKTSRIVRHGDYERTLDIYLKYFDSQQILICFYDAILFDSVALLSGITNFLGVSSYQPEEVDDKTIVNSSPKHNISPKVKDYLIETYNPMINRLSKSLGSYATVWNEMQSSYQMEFYDKYPISKLSPIIHP